MPNTRSRPASSISSTACRCSVRVSRGAPPPDAGYLRGTAAGVRRRRAGVGFDRSPCPASTRSISATIERASSPLRDRLAGIAPPDRVLEAVPLRVTPEPHARRIVPRDAVEHRRQGLQVGQPQVLDRLVDDQLVHHQHRLRDAGHALGERVDRVVESRRRHRVADQAPRLRGRAIDQIAGQHEALRALDAHLVEPPGGRRAAPDPGRHVADPRRVLHHHLVAAERDVRAARDRVLLHARDDRLVRPPQAHEVVGDPFHRREVDHRIPGDLLLLARMFAAALAVDGDVEAGAEHFATSLQDDHVHVRVGVRLADRAPDLPGHLVGDRVVFPGPIERDPRDPAVRPVLAVGECRIACHPDSSDPAAARAAGRVIRGPGRARSRCRAASSAPSRSRGPRPHPAPARAAPAAATRPPRSRTSRTS